MLTCLIFALVTTVRSDSNFKDLNLLTDLPLEKLLKLKSSMQELVTPTYNNISTTPASYSYLERFGSQAMALKNSPIKRTDYETGLHKKAGYSKISSIFSISITTLAFLAFGGYLLCLIVQAVKTKTQYYNPSTPPTVFISSGIKKRPQFASYGRKRRNADMDLPAEELFKILLNVCEGYAKWSERNRFSRFRTSKKPRNPEAEFDHTTFELICAVEAFA